MNPAGKFPTKSERIERLEQEISSCKNSYALLCNAVIGDGFETSDWKDPVKIAKAHLEELEQFRKREHDRQIIRDSEALDRQDDLEAALRKEFNRDFRPK